MPTFFRRFLDRAAEKVNRSAEGTAVPAGLEPAEPGERARPTARERTLIRRRLRTLRKRRATLASSDRTATRELEQIDAEAEMLRAALAERTTLGELLATGTHGRCSECGELVARRERECARCGARLSPGREAADQHSVSRSARAPAPAAPTMTTAASSGRSPTPPAR